MARRAGLLIVGTALLTGCASHGPPKPDVLPTPEPANARVRLYSACLAAADRAGTVQKFGRLIRFTCEGAPAHALYDAMGPFATARGWESADDGVRVRRTSSRAWDDQCAASPAALPAAWSCRLHMAVGDFLNPDKDTPAARPKS